MFYTRDMFNVYRYIVCKRKKKGSIEIVIRENVNKEIKWIIV